MQNQATDTGAISIDDLATIPALVAQFPHVLSEATLRWQLRFRDTNGLNAAVVPMGKKLMISKTRYERWLATQAGARRVS
jgi:hypothetical protein